MASKKNSNYKGSRKGKSDVKGNGKSFNKESRNDKNSDVSCGRETAYNDPKWYEPYPGANQDVASLAFSNVMGLDEPIGLTSVGGGINHVVPGVLALQTAPTIGGSGDYRDAINTCAMRLYSYVRHANSGHANYDPTDLMIYCMAVSNVYAWITHAFRVYGIANTYSMKNRYLPRALVEACHIDFDSLMSNLPAYRAKLNNLVYKIAPFAVPKMTYFDRLMGEYSNWFVDEADISKAQSYVITPALYYVYGLDATGKGCLKTGELVPDLGSGVGANWTAFLNIIETMIDAIAASEDCGIMSGDILKAFGDSGIYHMNVLTEGYNLSPVYDSEYLAQIKNATLFNEMEIDLNREALNTPNDGSWGIYQTDNGVLVQNPRFLAFSNEYGDDGVGLKRPLLNGVGDYDADRVMEETRFMVVPHLMPNEPGRNDAFSFHTMPASIITSASIGVMDKGADAGTGDLRVKWHRIYGMYEQGSTNDKINANAYAKAVDLISAFRYGPVIRMYDSDESTGLLKNVYSNTRWANYTYVAEDVLDRMHRNAMYGLFTVPDITGSFGKLTK